MTAVLERAVTPVRRIDSSLRPSKATGLLSPLCKVPSDEQLIVLTGEPGLGKTHMADVLAREGEQRGSHVWKLSYRNIKPERATNHIVRSARDIVSHPSKEAALVCVDDVPSLDECDVSRVSKAFARMAANGARIILCLRPEAEQLREALGDHYLFRSRDLCFRSCGDGSHQERSLWEATHGVASLVVAKKTDSSFGASPQEYGPRYREALIEAISASLRQGLTREERTARFVLLLLGSGSFQEAREVFARCDEEFFVDLHKHAPLYGINLREKSFSCAGISQDVMLAACLDALQSAGSEVNHVASAACGLLAKRGDMRRAALACRLIPSEERLAHIVCRWGVHFLDLGEIELVEEGLKAAKRAGLDNTPWYSICSLALANLLARSVEVDKTRTLIRNTLLHERAHGTSFRLASLFGEARDVGRGVQVPLLVSALASEEEATLCMAEHVHMRKTLFSGHFSEVFKRLGETFPVARADCLHAALLVDDYLVAQILCGVRPDQTATRLMEESEQFFARCGIPRLKAYRAAMLPALSILMGRGRKAEHVDSAISRAESMGDSVVQAFFLLVAAVCDIRIGALPRAHIRASKAAQIAASVGERYLGATAPLIDALTLELLGEAGALERCMSLGKLSEELDVLAPYLLQAAGAHASSWHAELKVNTTSLPANVLWIVNLLLNDCGKFSAEFGRAIPTQWHSAFHLAQDNLEGILLGKEDEALPTGSSQGAQMVLVSNGVEEPVAHRIQLTVLGGLSVRVDGELLSARQLEKRKARELLIMLAASKNHHVRRYRATEAIWNLPYRRGKHQLYQATTALRSLLGAHKGLDPIITERGSGLIALDSSLVWVDIDEFEHEARQVLTDDGNDALTLNHARRMMSLFRGGPETSLASLGLLGESRGNELKALFIDAAIVASEAAARTNRVGLAMRFAADAHTIDELREDAMLAFIRALELAGRGSEVEEHYLRFCKRLAARRGAPPSPALRRMVQRIAGEL